MKANDINDILGKAEFVKKENKDRRSEKLENFEIKKLLGKGAYGKVNDFYIYVLKVMLVEHRVTKKLYAMKSIRKDIAIKKE